MSLCWLSWSQIADSSPLTRLFKHLFASVHMTVDVITPNYDRLAEYAADAGEFSHFTGFSYGYLQSRVRNPNTRVHYGRDIARTVCIWKVDGSLDWFRDPTNQIIAARTFRDIPTGYAPLMITPGLEKYKLAHAEPFRTIFMCSDAALDRARAYLCIGYGFNDEHVQTKLVERCEAIGVPLIVITKELTSQARAFLGNGRCRKYLAFEEAPAGVRAFSPHHVGGIELPANAIWQLGKFLDFTLGAET